MSYDPTMGYQRKAPSRRRQIDWADWIAGFIAFMLVLGLPLIGLLWSTFGDQEPADPCTTRACVERQVSDDLRYDFQDRLGGSR